MSNYLTQEELITRVGGTTRFNQLTGAGIAEIAPDALNGGIDNVMTALVVASGLGTLQLAVPFYFQIDSEILACTDVASLINWTVARAQGGTTAASHADAAVVTYLNGLQADIVQEVLDNLDAEADSYFSAAGYEVPVTAPQLSNIKSSLLDIANYRIKTRGDAVCTDDDRNLFKAAVTAMQNVAKNVIVLARVAELEAGAVIIEAPQPQLFNRSSLRNF